MSPEKNSPAEANAATEIVSTRTFAATREAVFGAFTDPQKLAQWWGPNGFTNTFHKFDLRPGGRWEFTMHAPDGARFDNVSEFREILAPERIIFEHLGPVHWYRMTMTFAAQNGQTTLTWRMRFETAAEVAQLGHFIAAANEENFDRLAAHLAKTLKP